jgi:hypothetical protein
MNRITRSLASLTLVVGIGAGALATAGTAAAASPASAHRVAADGDTQKKNKDGKDIPPPSCNDDLHALNGLVDRLANISEVAAMMQGWLRSGAWSSEEYDSYYRGVNDAAHQVQRDFKAAMWRYLDAGCRILGPVPILPGWTDMQDAAHTLAG